MAQEYDGEELVVYWTLLPAEAALVGGKRGPARLGFAVLLKFFQREGRFPQRSQDVSPAAIAHLAAQVGIPVAQWRAYYYFVSFDLPEVSFDKKGGYPWIYTPVQPRCPSWTSFWPPSRCASVARSARLPWSAT